jgi:uncharacterized protein YfdQ (DUF2303 family)
MSDQDTQAIIETAVRAAEPDALDNDTALYSLVVPEGSQHVVIDTERLLAPYKPQPRRQRGQVALTTPASLVAYLNDHKIAGSKIFADWRRSTATAVLNDHAGFDAGWGDHRAVLTLMATPEWSAWTALDGKWLSQEDFAEHILATASDVVAPSAADLMEMAETFVATKSVNFKSGSRLRDGQRQLTYVEVIEAQAGPAGNVTIPESILLRLAPFDGAEPVEMGARIRYRINEGALRLGYVLDRPDLVLRTAFAGVVAGVEEQTGITALWGTPRS